MDAAFLCHALLRAPQGLTAQIDDRVRHNLVRALALSRRIRPSNTNWLLFSAMLEAGLHLLGDSNFSLEPVRTAIDQFAKWYKGDGFYGDGPVFHMDYYNSFVIQPMLVDLLRYFPEVFAGLEDAVMKRARRYAAVQERQISPEGTYPIVGRSICYRFGSFQLLAQAAWQHFLPSELNPAQVRCALTAVMKRILSAPGTFDEGGWLLPGVWGYQPSLAESYICVGSLYLCAAVFLPLGLSPSDPFWADPDEKWTSQKIYSGEDLKADHAYL